MTSLLEKLKDMSAEEVLGLNARGYRNQWEAGWQVLHPNKMLVGRAVTLQMMPARPDISGVDQADRRARNQTVLNHQTAFDMLQKGDVLVVDTCGTQFGGVIGDNLAYYIMKKTGTDSSSMAQSVTFAASRPSIWPVTTARRFLRPSTT